MKRSFIFLAIVLSGCTTVSVLPDREVGYYAVGVSLLTEDAIVCEAGKPKHLSVLGADFPKHQMLNRHVEIDGVQRARTCELFEMASVATIPKGQRIFVEHFKVVDSSFPLAVPNLYAVGTYVGANGKSASFFRQLGHAEFPYENIWEK
ncbi:hypothetical protein [Thiosocius teredinicola]|uniref:hypothetical protein n=1 Tax=Thiosocius teredinicola TaxID=1973002 RepID=UPI000F77E050